MSNNEDCTHDECSVYINDDGQEAYSICGQLVSSIIINDGYNESILDYFDDDVEITYKEKKKKKVGKDTCRYCKTKYTWKRECSQMCMAR